MKSNRKILTEAIEYLEDDTRSGPDKFKKTVIIALNAIRGELNAYRQPNKGVPPSTTDNDYVG